MFADTYLFIDGGYLREVYRERFEPIFGAGYLVDYTTLMHNFDARRIFLYDCLDDVQRQGEKDEDFKARVQRQQDLFDAIDRVEDVHVRYGYLSPGRKRQQKEVDVLLAVEMLTFAFHKTVAEAVLLSGDRDFKPVVESVVRLGTRVMVAYDPRSSSEDLARAADRQMRIDITALCRWAQLPKYEDRTRHFPTESPYDNHPEEPLKGMSPAPESSREGVIGPGKQALRFCEIGQRCYASVRFNARDYKVYHFHERAKLLAFLKAQFGEIVWDS